MPEGHVCINFYLASIDIPIRGRSVIISSGDVKTQGKPKFSKVFSTAASSSIYFLCFLVLGLGTSIIILESLFPTDGDCKSQIFIDVTWSAVSESYFKTLGISHHYWYLGQGPTGRKKGITISNLRT